MIQRRSANDVIHAAFSHAGLSAMTMVRLIGDSLDSALWLRSAGPGMTTVTRLPCPTVGTVPDRIFRRPSA